MRGSVQCFKIMFRLVGITAVINEIFIDDYRFDSPITLDDPGRRFDVGRCNACSDFDLTLTGPALTPIILAAINGIVNFNTPINGRLKRLYYNGGQRTVEAPSAVNRYKYIIN